MIETSGHLPECGYKPCNCGYEDDPRGNWAGHLRCSHVPCICDRLRACEQRVNSSNLTLWDRTQEQSQHMITSGLGIAWKDGFKEGLDAAREAVAETQRWHEFSWGMDDDEDGEYVKTEEALAAIDALRQERSGNPDAPPPAENEAIDALKENK